MIRALVVVACVGAAGAQSELRLESRVFGKVVDAGDAPLEGAAVRAVRSYYAGVPMGILRAYLPRRPVELASTTTDAHGRFELSVDPSLPFGLRVASADGAMIGGVGAPIPPFRVLDIRLKPVAEVRGRVVPTGDDVRLPEGLEVAVLVDDEGANPRPWCAGTAPIAADGTFVASVPRGVDCSLEAGTPLASLSIRLPETGSVDAVELPLALQRVRGRLTSESDEKPIADATVRAVPAGTSARTDADGSFDVVVVDDGYLQVDAPGRAVTYLRGGGPPADATVPLAHPVRGRLTVDGLPLTGAEIVALRMANGPNGSSVGLLELRTDDAGRFTIDGRAPWTGVAAWVRAGDRFVRFVDVPKGDAAVDLDDVSIASGAIVGVVLDPYGVPAPYVPIHVQVDDDAFGSRFGLGQWPVTTTNHAGNFVIRGLLPGRELHVVTIGPGSYPAATDATPQGQDPIRVELRLLAAPVFEGRVVDKNGAPVAGRWVYASAYEKVDPVLRSMGLWASGARTDAEGRFRLPARAADVDHDVHVAGGAEHLRLPPGTEDIELVAPDGK